MRAALIDLVLMTERELSAFLDKSIARYAEENVRAGYWTAAEASEKSKADHSKVLPQGLATKDHYLFNIVQRKSGQKVGTVWMAMKRGDSTELSGFIYDLYIDPDHRRKGHATQAMLAIEHKAGELGAGALRLHVFGHNAVARELYSRLGYETTSLNMAKRL